MKTEAASSAPPLAGIRVIDMTVALAGPYGAMLLGDLGAEVIRVESTQWRRFGERGHFVRPPKEALKSPGRTLAYPNGDPGERPWNRDARFNAANRSKLSMTVDLRKPEGVAVFKELVAQSDVVVENNAAGVMDRLGLGWSVLRRCKPDLIMIAGTALGQTGPFKELHGYGSHCEALFGSTSLRGYPDLDPTTTSPVAPVDAAGGAAMVFSVMAALLHRRRTGEGQYVDLSLAENFLPFIGEALMDYAMNGRVQTTLGNHHHAFAPHNCYRCRGEDAWINITVTTDREWEALCRVMGDESLAADPRFCRSSDRWRRQDEMDRRIESWTRGHDPVDLMRRLQAAGVPAGAVMDERMCFADPHLRERGFFAELDHPDAGKHQYPGAAWKMSGTPLRVERPAPCLGQHNEYVYKELLGYSDEAYRRFEKAGHIGTEYAAHVT